ncbi:MAG TPA: hypothetical protein VEF33_12715 [Syntrophales bacterium]|nr:hypothetical protein [Syntrophales bacterium]
MHGVVKRIRPKFMTVSVILAGLVTIMFSHGTVANVSALPLSHCDFHSFKSTE